MDKKHILYGFALALLVRSFLMELTTADAFIHGTLFIVVGAYLALDLYLSKTIAAPVEAQEMKEDVEDLKSKVSTMALRDGFKFK